MGHRLIHGTSDVCATPHGHNENVTVYLKPLKTQPLDGKANIIIPFHQAKLLWHRFIDGSVDHAFQLSENDPLLQWFIDHEPTRIPHLLVTPGDPTTELLACLFMSKINVFLQSENTGLSCYKIKLQETPTNTVCFSGDPLEFIPQSSLTKLSWWQRADMSISDLKL